MDLLTFPKHRGLVAVRHHPAALLGRTIAAGTVLFTPLSKEVSIIPNGFFFYFEIFPSQKVQAVICPLFLAAAQVQSYIFQVL